jgi:hypothetical protein
MLEKRGVANRTGNHSDQDFRGIRIIVVD